MKRKSEMLDCVCGCGHHVAIPARGDATTYCGWCGRVFYTRDGGALTTEQMLRGAADKAMRLARRYRALARVALHEYRLLDDGCNNWIQSTYAMLQARLTRLDTQAGFGRKKGRTP